MAGVFRLGLVLGLVLGPGLGAGLLTPGPVLAQGRAAVAAVAPDRSPAPPRRPAFPGAMAGLVASPTGIARQSAPPIRPAGLVPAGPVAPTLPAAPTAQVPANMVPVATTGAAPVLPPMDLAEAPPMPAAALVPDVADEVARAVAAARAASGHDPVRDALQDDPYGPAGLGAAALVEVVTAAPPVPLPPQRPTFSTPIDPAAAPMLPNLAPPARPARPPVVDRITEPDDPRAVVASLLPQARTPGALRRFEAAVAARPTPRATIPRASTPQAPAIQAALPVPPAASGGPGLCGMAGLQGRRLPRVTSSTSGCGIDDPVSLTHVHGVRLNPPATLHCDAARATGRWVREVVQPAVGRQGGGVVEMRLGSHYACRPRNNQRGARVSEHGRGRAIDIMSLRLANGEQVSILRDYSRGPYSEALRRMRAGACGIFRTTLGPGSDRFHADHFHFDMAQHRNGGTYCR